MGVLAALVWAAVLFRFMDDPPDLDPAVATILPPAAGADTLPVRPDRQRIPDALRDPFQPPAPSVPPAGVVPPPVVAPPRVRAVGALRDNRGPLLLVADSSGRVRVVRPGDTVGSLRIDAVGDSAALGWFGQRRWRLPLDGEPPLEGRR